MNWKVFIRDPESGDEFVLLFSSLKVAKQFLDDLIDETYRQRNDGSHNQTI